MSFVHLHTHSYYSLLDGLRSPDDMVAAVKAFGSPALAITDHGVLFGAIDFYKAAKKANIKPIIGCEMYVAPRTRFDKDAGIDNKPYHLTVLARNYTGYQNLLQLVTKSNLEGFYYKPRVDHALIGVYHEGLIVLSGCINGEVARAILAGDMARARELISFYRDTLGKDSYYLEIQDNPLLEQQVIVNKALVELSREMGVPLVVTCDSHYVREDESYAHDILLAIQTQTNIHDENRMKFTGHYHLRSPDEVMRAFSDLPQAVSQTLSIAEMCDIEIPLHQNLLPPFTTPNGEPPDEYVRMLAYEGLHRRYGEHPPEHVVKQLEYELDVVHSMGFDSYFLIVHDFVSVAKSRDIVVGPGRGSAAGSILSYCLNITQLDPLRYGLIFERFLNPERISMPDIDIDFADNRRGEILQYVTEKYGRENVAQIITFGTMASRAAVRDVGRALGFSYADVDVIAKKVPPPIQGRHVLLKESLVNDPELRDLYARDAQAKTLLDTAIQLEGTVRHAGTHACAVVISKDPLVQYTPLQFGAGESEDIVTQYSMKPIEDIGLLKMDFLGLKNLTIIEDTLRIVKKYHGITIELDTLPMDDVKTFELLQRGETTGVFQLESAGMRRYLQQLVPTRFEDIIAMVALYRPGPMEWIPRYVDGKHHPDSVKYLDKSFATILQETYGVAVYQEQILQIAREFAGFSLGEADILRKAVGKKIPSLLNEQKEKFIQGAVAKKHTKGFAEEVFEKVIEPFAGYGFNKAHAACYAMIAYQTAYLKANYPDAFMTALLISDQGNADRIAIEIEECEAMGIRVLPPSINESDKNFTLVETGKIRFGLLAIKGVGEQPIVEMLRIRDLGGRFVSLQNFVERVPAKWLNKKTFSSLACGGALEDLGERAALSENFDRIISYAKQHQKSQAQGQVSLFDEVSSSGNTPMSFSLERVRPADRMTSLKWEKELLGLYVSGHPLQGLRRYFAKKVMLIDQITKRSVGKTLQFGGLVTNAKKIFTKAGAYMMTFYLEDPTGRLQAVVYPKSYHLFASVLAEDSIVVVGGRLNVRGTEYAFIVDSVKGISLDSMVASAQELNLYNPQERVTRVTPRVAGVETRSDDAADYLPHGNDDDVGPSADSGVAAVDQDETVDRDAIVNPFIITLPATVSTDVLNELRRLLESNPGERPVELRLQSGVRAKRVKLPLRVAVSPPLEQSLADLFARAKIG